MAKGQPLKDTEIGMIPEDWAIRELKEVARINESVVDKNFKFAEIEYIDIDSVEDGSINNSQLLPLKDAPSRARRIVKKNDIIISTVRPNLRHFAFVKETKPNTVVSTGFAVISCKSINPRFLYYYLTTNRYTEHLTAIADSHTSTYPSFNVDVLENSPIPYPDVAEQEAIAKVLTVLDGKIELNQKMNKTLEAIGKAIFRRWFIDFEFPNEEGKPYKSSSGEMVYDEELGKEIPKEWKVGDVLEVANILSGGTPKTEVAEYWEGGIPWVSAKDVTNSQGSFIIDTERTITQLGMDNSNAKMLPRYTTVVTARGVVGSYCILSREMTINQTNYGLKAKSSGDLFVFFSISSLVNQLKQHSYGTIFDTITTKTFHEMRVAIPPDYLMKSFEEKAGNVMGKILTNLQQSRSLANIRDALLPKLMSGKVRIPRGG
jgi:type I restriction enzyme S subunit